LVLAYLYLLIPISLLYKPFYAIIKGHNETPASAGYTPRE